MKTKHRQYLAALISLSAACALAAPAQTCETLINLGFTPNTGNIAAHPNVSNITPWANGSEIYDDPFDSGLYYMPGSNFGNGYAEITSQSLQFGYKWGFEGAFDLTSTNPWQVCSISFDYDVFGQNGESSLALTLGQWSGSAPLPSTGSDWDLPTDTWPPSSLGQRSYGTVTFDFVTKSLTVTRTGVHYQTQLETIYSPVTIPLTDVFSLSTGTHAIDILVSNTRAQSDGGYFDTNAASTLGDPGFYRIDNFQVLAAPTAPTSIPTLSEWGTIILSSLLALGTVLVMRRQRR
jgi:IPTL-CTERM motif